MIDPKRRLHRIMWLVAASVLPVILIAGYLGQQGPRPGASGESLQRSAEIRGTQLAAWQMLNGSLSFDLRSHDGNAVLHVARLNPIKRPDVLLYLDEHNRSLLLGEATTAPSRSFPLLRIPGETVAYRLYDLAHQEDIETFRPGKEVQP